MICPTREDLGLSADVFKLPSEDSWIDRDGVRHCSFCGSLHPDDFMAAIERGEEATPTDKCYKVYLRSARGKFYWLHLTDEQQKKFIKLLNHNQVNIAFPGRFYVLPLFMHSVPAEPAQAAT